MRDKDKDAKLPEKLREASVNPMGASIANSPQGQGRGSRKQRDSREWEEAAGSCCGAHKVARHFDERHAVLAGRVERHQRPGAGCLGAWKLNLI